MSEALKKHFADRSFHSGDYVGWNSEAGHVSGTITRVHTQNFEVNGYTHHCSTEDPQYEIRSSKTDHVAYHKASALHHLSNSDESLPPHGFKTLAKGTHVTWHYRGAIGHGVIVGVHKLGTTADNTEYSIRQSDHHVSKSGSKEHAIVFHYREALTIVSQ